MTERKLAGRPASMEVPPGLLAAMEGDYNASQMAAVRSGLTGDDVLLIQGPPGALSTTLLASARVDSKQCSWC